MRIPIFKTRCEKEVIGYITVKDEFNLKKEHFTGIEFAPVFREGEFKGFYLSEKRFGGIRK